MSRAVFATVFALFAAAFLPVMFLFGFYLIAPVSGMLVALVDPAWPRRSPQMMFWSLSFAVGWLVVFWIAGFILDGPRETRFPGRYHSVLRLALLALVFSASFAPVLTWGNLRRHGGTYSFWTAVPRYFERREAVK